MQGLSSSRNNSGNVISNPMEIKNAFLPDNSIESRQHDVDSANLAKILLNSMNS